MEWITLKLELTHGLWIVNELQTLNTSDCTLLRLQACVLMIVLCHRELQYEYEHKYDQLLSVISATYCTE